MYVIGRGGFGKVWKVQCRKTNKIYALKVMDKSKILAKKSVNSVLNERYLLSQLCFPFLVNMNFAYQDSAKIYLVMDLLAGGDLRYHLCRIKTFSEEQTSILELIRIFHCLHNFKS